MVAAHACMKYVTRMQPNHLHLALQSVVHINLAIHHRKHFLPIVHMPVIGLIGPVQANAHAFNVRNIQGSPGFFSKKFFPRKTLQSDLFIVRP